MKFQDEITSVLEELAGDIAWRILDRYSTFDVMQGLNNQFTPGQVNLFFDGLFNRVFGKMIGERMIGSVLSDMIKYPDFNYQDSLAAYQTGDLTRSSVLAHGKKLGNTARKRIWIWRTP
jgi:hypothetical protein